MTCFAKSDAAAHPLPTNKQPCRPVRPQQLPLLNPAYAVTDEEMLTQEEISVLLDAILTEQEAFRRLHQFQDPFADQEHAAALPGIQPVKQKLRPPKSLWLLIAVAVVLITLGACLSALTMLRGATPPSSRSPQVQLQSKGIRFTAEDFISYAGSGDKEVTQLFLQAGMSADSRRNSDGFTPLMAAASFGRLDIIELLRYHGAALDLRDRDGQTALMKAVFYKQPQTASRLLNAGANSGLTDYAGHSALTLALVAKDPRLLQILAQASPAAALPPDAFIIQQQQAGYIKLGQSLSDLANYYLQDDNNAAIINGRASASLFLDGSATPSLLATLSQDQNDGAQSINSIHIYDQRFITTYGLGIGSTLGELRQAGLTSIEHIEHTLYAVDGTIRFELAVELNQLPLAWLQTGSPAALPDNIHVGSIIIRHPH